MPCPALPCPCRQPAAEIYRLCSRTRAAAGVPGGRLHRSAAVRKRAGPADGEAGMRRRVTRRPGCHPTGPGSEYPWVVMAAALDEGGWSLPHDLGGTLGRVSLGVCLDASGGAVLFQHGLVSRSGFSLAPRSNPLKVESLQVLCAKIN